MVFLYHQTSYNIPVDYQQALYKRQSVTSEPFISSHPLKELTSANKNILISLGFKLKKSKKLES